MVVMVYKLSLFHRKRERNERQRDNELIRMKNQREAAKR
jgi:hypothetical protein